LLSGQPYKFSLPALMASIVSGYILFTLVFLLVDGLVIYVIPGSSLYRSAKYERTENFNDLRKDLFSEQNLKKKIDAVSKMARFKDTPEVEEVINGMQTNITEREFEQVLLACIEVYGSELLDYNSANVFVAKLKTDKSKIRAFILMNQLKEAYLLAAKIESTEDVRTVQNEALNTNNTRVQQLCDQYLAGQKIDDVPSIELKVKN